MTETTRIAPPGAAIPAAPGAPRTVRRLLPSLLLLLTAFGPISMDLYLPVLPALTADLAASTSVAQLTVTACLIGLALGQLVAGPVSDQLGRRGVLLIGIVAYLVASVLCALSPSAELLIAARFVQGAAGGVGIVIAQAGGRDIFDGGGLIRFYGRLTVVGGFAAIVGPLLGGQLSTLTDWRGLFLALGGIGAVILLATLVLFTETLPLEQRQRGGLVRSLADMRVLLRDRVVVAAVLNQGLMYAALFAYLSGSTYVLQSVYALTPQQYALVFGLNSAGFMALGAIAGRSAERWSVRGTLGTGILLALVGAGGLLFAGLTPVPLVVVIVALFALVGGVALSSPPATTLALAAHPTIAGTASSLLGAVRFGLGGVAAPLVGLAGAAAILPLGIVTVVAVLGAGAAWMLGAPRTTATPSPHRRP